MQMQLPNKASGNIPLTSKLVLFLYNNTTNLLLTLEWIVEINTSANTGWPSLQTDDRIEAGPAEGRCYMLWRPYF